MQKTRYWGRDDKGQTAPKKGQRDEYVYGVNEARSEKKRQQSSRILL